MLIADTHCDTLYAMGVEHVAEPVVTAAKMQAGGVGLQVCALWSGPHGNAGDVQAILNAEMSQIPALTAAGLKQVRDPSEVAEGEHCFMLSIEGGEAFNSGIGSVAEWADKGVRMAAILWNNECDIGYSAKSGDRRGLKPYGVEVARELQKHHMAVDVSHLNEAGFNDLFLKTDHVPMASHSCCRKLCDHFRNLTDEQIRMLIRDGGYIGVNFYPWFLHESGKADLNTLFAHIDRICQMGGEKNVGFGSDFDGIECMPDGLNGPQDIPSLINIMRMNGYPEKTVEDIAGRNLVTYFSKL